MLSRRRLLQLAIAGLAAAAVQPWLAHASDASAAATVSEIDTALARICGRHARKLFAVLALSPRGFSIRFLSAVLWPELGPWEASTQLDASAYMVRRSLDDDRVVVRTRRGYRLAPHIPGFESLRSELQARFVRLALEQPGLLPPTRRKWVRRTLARGDAEGAVALVLAS